MLHVILDILKIVAELQQDTPVKSEPRFFVTEETVGETCIGEHGRAAFEAADTEDFDFAGALARMQLREAVFLRVVDGEQGFEDAGNRWRENWSSIRRTSAQMENS